jgi:small-conductance mechanosensitive channel
LTINRRFKEEGITIPFPQQDVHIKTIENLAEEPAGD